jgi:hypothetical protein
MLSWHAVTSGAAATTRVLLPVTLRRLGSDLETSAGAFDTMFSD